MTASPKLIADLIAESDRAAAEAEKYASMMLKHATPEQREWFLAKTRERIAEIRVDRDAWLQRLTESAGRKAQ
jgi:hypothetical protein